MTRHDDTPETTPDAPSPPDRDERAPHPPPEYNEVLAVENAIGGSSSYCEVCGSEIDGHDFGTFVVGQLRSNDFRDENHAVACRECGSKPGWRDRVRSSRATQRDDDLTDKLTRWLYEPPAKTLFARRVAAVIGGLLVATLGVALLGIMLHGTATAYSPSVPVWIVIVALTGGYLFHLEERDRNDMRGTRVREFSLSERPWSRIVAGALAMVAGTFMASAGTLVTGVIGVAIYLTGTGTVFALADRAVRADRCHPRVDWTPRYGRELFLLRTLPLFGAGSLILSVVIGTITDPVDITIALLPAVATGGYLYLHMWNDLGEDWPIFYNGPDTQNNARNSNSGDQQ